MAPWLPHVYRLEGLGKGYRETIVTRALEIALKQQHFGLPAILTLKHLASQCGVSYRYLRDVISRQHDSSYRLFKLARAGRTPRWICVPEPDLARTQKWIARNVLNRCVIHPAAYAYAPGTNCIECAAVHCGCRWLIKLDVRSFFESISERQIYHVFNEIGYEPLVAFELARICTRIPFVLPKHYNEARWISKDCSKYTEIMSYQSSILGHLPQGAPTSPMLSNLVMVNFDDKVEKLSKTLDLVYTRYSDDLIFSSGKTDFKRSSLCELLSSISEEMRKMGLRIRHTKTSVSPPGARKVVLGLLVDGETPRLTKKFRDKLRIHVYYICRFGPGKHAERRGFNSIHGMKRHIEGLLTYAEAIEPKFARALKNKLEHVNW